MGDAGRQGCCASWRAWRRPWCQWCGPRPGAEAGSVAACRGGTVDVGACAQCFTSRVSLGLKEGGKRKKPKHRDESKKKKATKGQH